MRGRSGSGRSSAPDYLGDDHVFTWENGRAVQPDVIRQRFNRQVAALGLRRIRLHDLRHSYATAALAAGVSPKIVSERLGHASVAFTLSQYTHLLPGLDRDAASTVAAILLGPTSPPGNPGEGGPDAAR
ncbi:MAG TPA: tyrosine-type recombinase/integrase [Trebonia sp.]|nr:tyrosine-type recombinase/integrase [Trebonia sp.]